MADTGEIGTVRGAFSNPGGWKSLIIFFVLALAWIAGFSSRLFSVIRFESVIHEFDPWYVSSYIITFILSSYVHYCHSLLTKFLCIFEF